MSRASSSENRPRMTTLRPLILSITRGARSIARHKNAHHLSYVVFGGAGESLRARFREHNLDLSTFSFDDTRRVNIRVRHDTHIRAPGSGGLSGAGKLTFFTAPSASATSSRRFVAVGVLLLLGAAVVLIAYLRSKNRARSTPVSAL